MCMSRADQQARTRSALLRSAAARFGRVGYHATTIDDIARRARFTRGAFYANFRDKGDVFLSVLEQRHERDLARLSATLDNTTDAEVPDRIAEWMDQVLVAGDLRRAMAEFTLVAETNPTHRARLAADLRTIRDATAEILQRYRERHHIELTVDDTTFATIIAALVGGIADLMRLEPESASTELATVAITALWSGLQL